MPYLPEAKIEAFRLMPGAASLLDALADEPGVYLVGGAVRDMLLGFAQFDFDVAVEGDSAALAQRLATALHARVKIHKRFGTASVFFGPDEAYSVDIATTRTETYDAPGALPDVSPADLATDLARRDFTVNAMAVALWRDRIGELSEFDGASADLAARVLRITHDQSFVDDPTRLLRLLRYGARLGFTAEPHTESLAIQAVSAQAPSTVSGPRIADELMDLLSERSAVVAIESMAALGLDRALQGDFEADEYVAARATMHVSEGLRRDLLLLACCSRKMDAVTVDRWVDWLGLRHGERTIVRDAVTRNHEVRDAVSATDSVSAFDAALRRFCPETVALAAALPSVDAGLRERLLEWLDARSQQHLLITGADLRAAGIEEGPKIGIALADTLALALDGDINDREQQLEYALSRARGIGKPRDPR